MKTTINLHQFREAFREIRPDNFSYEGLEALYECFTEMEEDTGEEMELDVIAICCEYAEATPREIVDDYNIDISECEDDADVREKVIAHLCEHSFVAGGTTNTLVYQQF